MCTQKRVPILSEHFHIVLIPVNGEVPCKFCVSKQRKIEYDLSHQPTPVERNIIQQESEIFVTPESSKER